MADHPELTKAVADYIEARKRAAAAEAIAPRGEVERVFREIEGPAWEIFYPIKLRYWLLDHPES